MAMSDESGPSIGQFEAKEVPEQDPFHLLEQPTQGVQSLVVGAVQQGGKLYGSNRYRVR